MKNNLSAQYEEISKAIEDFFKQVLLFSKRAASFRHPNLLFKLLFNFVFYPRVNFVTRKQSAFIRSVWKIVTTDGEKKTPVYSVIDSDYPIDSLTQYLKKKFPAVNFRKLHRLNKTKLSTLGDRGLNELFAIIFAVGTILLKTVPKSIVSPFIDYDRYQAYVFVITIAVIIYFGIFALPVWIKLMRAKSRLRQIGLILEYAALTQKEQGK